MSPNKFDPTTTSNLSGRCTKCAVRMSMWYWSVRHVGILRAMAVKRSSQNGMVTVMPFDFVAEVSCLRGRVCASSNA